VPGLVPGTHVFVAAARTRFKTWMPGPSPGTGFLCIESGTDVDPARIPHLTPALSAPSPHPSLPRKRGRVREGALSALPVRLKGGGEGAKGKPARRGGICCAIPPYKTGDDPQAVLGSSQVYATPPNIIPRLIPGSTVFFSWMAGSSPAMTV